MAKELSLGMSVSCSDGEVGRLERIVVDPDTREPAYLVVRRGRVSQRDTVVPVSLVTEITSEGIVLGIGSEAFKTFPDYEITVEKYLPEEYDYVSRWPEIPPLWKAGVQNDGMVKVRERTVSEHTADISRGMKVFDDAGVAVGEIEGVIADPDTRQASHLVLARGLPAARERRLVPVDLVDFALRSHVYLRISECYLQGLPVYQKA